MVKFAMNRVATVVSTAASMTIIVNCGRRPRRSRRGNMLYVLLRSPGPGVRAKCLSTAPPTLARASLVVPARSISHSRNDQRREATRSLRHLIPRSTALPLYRTALIPQLHEAQSGQIVQHGQQLALAAPG